MNIGIILNTPPVLIYTFPFNGIYNFTLKIRSFPETEISQEALDCNFIYVAVIDGNRQSSAFYIFKNQSMTIKMLSSFISKNTKIYIHYAIYPFSGKLFPKDKFPVFTNPKGVTANYVNLFCDFEILFITERDKIPSLMKENFLQYVKRAAHL